MLRWCVGHAEGGSGVRTSGTLFYFLEAATTLGHQRREGTGMTPADRPFTKQERREFLADRKSTGCVLCGSLDILEFHHIHPRYKRFSIGRAPLNISRIKLFLELDKCVVLCGKCHGSVHGPNPPPEHITRPDLYVLLQEAIVRG